MNPPEREAMAQALAALRMSSPNTDSLYRWRSPEWRQQRFAAIETLAAIVEPQAMNSGQPQRRRIPAR